MSNVKVGQTVKVDLQLLNGETNQFPQTILRDASNAPITGSPLALTHVAGGLYSGTFTMPDTSKVTGVTTVYTDAGFTTPNNDYYPSTDEFFAIDLTVNVTSNFFGPTDLEGEIDDGTDELSNC